MKHLVVSILLLLCAGALLAQPISAVDSGKTTVTLKETANRIVALSPHLTELVYAAGAGNKLVGVSEYSNYPPEARNLPTVSSFSGINLERVAALKPDLVLVWQSGTQPEWIAQLKKLGIPVFADEPQSFDDIAHTIEAIGELANTRLQAHLAAELMRKRAALLKLENARKAKVKVFYQISENPLLTINDTHFIARALHLCGAENVFGKLPIYVPTVNRESVLAANPDAIIIGADATRSTKPGAVWQDLKGLRAARLGTITAVNGALLHRQTPRALDEAEHLCREVDRVRVRLGWVVSSERTQKP